MNLLSVKKFISEFLTTKPSVVITLIIAVTLLGVATITTAPFEYHYKAQSVNTIDVKGMGEESFNSDIIIWNASITRDGKVLTETSAALEKDAKTVREYLKKEGIKDSDITFKSVSINKNYNSIMDQYGHSQSEFTGYSLVQSISITSQNEDVEKVAKVSNDITSLVSQGIEISSTAPDYFYSKLSDLKVSLIAKATTDARTRAEQIAKNSGAKVGKLKEASNGVFQITAKNSGEAYSDIGAFNTQSREKVASVTVKLKFEIE